MDLKEYIHDINGFPKPGVTFKDISPILKSPFALRECIDRLSNRFTRDNKFPSCIAGIEARGFIFGSILASRLEVPFIQIRKEGKLPGEILSQDYALEYGDGVLEIKKDSFLESDKVLIIDDVLATGGTALAAAKLCERCGATVIGIGFIIEIMGLNGIKKLDNYDVESLMRF